MWPNTKTLEGPWGPVWSPLSHGHLVVSFGVERHIPAKSGPNPICHCSSEFPCAHLDALVWPVGASSVQPSRPCALHTYHLLEQRGVPFSKEHAEVQDLWDVKQEVIVEDFSKCRGGNEVILRNSAEREDERPFKSILLVK